MALVFFFIYISIKYLFRIDDGMERVLFFKVSIAPHEVLLRCIFSALITRLLRKIKQPVYIIVYCYI